MNHKSCEHEANPSTECEVCGKSIDNVRKHTKEIHEGISKPCTPEAPEAENKNEAKNGDEENNEEYDDEDEEKYEAEHGEEGETKQTKHEIRSPDDPEIQKNRKYL